MRRPKLAAVELSWAPTPEPRPLLASALAFGRSERSPPLAAAQ
jgi:hypothetical protein